MDNFIFIYKKRIDLKNSNRLIIQTGSCKDYMKDVKAVSYVNGVETPVDIVENVHTPLLFVYKNAEPEFDGEYNFCIDLPKKVDNVKVVFTKDTYPSGKVGIYISGKQIEYLRSMIEINLIGVKVDEKSGRIKVTGWAEAAHEPVICAYSGNKKLAASVNFFTRADMVSRYFPDELNRMCAFEMDVEDIGGRTLRLTTECDGRHGSVSVLVNRGDDEKKQQRLVSAGNSRNDYITRARNYIALYGMKRFMIKLYGKCTGKAKKQSHDYFQRLIRDLKDLKNREAISSQIIRSFLF